MIVNTKSGLLVSGQVAFDPERKPAGTKEKIKLSVRYGYEPAENPGDRRKGKLLDIDVWDGVAALDGMIAKGDAVIVTGDEIQNREYLGKTYYSMASRGLYVDSAVVFRWMQQLVDMISALQEQVNYMAEQLGKQGDGSPARKERSLRDNPLPDAQQISMTDNGTDISSHELYPGEQLSDPAPGGAPAADTIGDAPIDDTEDLPF